MLVFAPHDHGQRPLQREGDESAAARLAASLWGQFQELSTAGRYTAFQEHWCAHCCQDNDADRQAV